MRKVKNLIIKALFIVALIAAILSMCSMYCVEALIVFIVSVDYMALVWWANKPRG